MTSKVGLPKPGKNVRGNGTRLSLKLIAISILFLLATLTFAQNDNTAVADPFLQPQENQPEQDPVRDDPPVEDPIGSQTEPDDGDDDDLDTQPDTDPEPQPDQDPEPEPDTQPDNSNDNDLDLSDVNNQTGNNTNAGQQIVEDVKNIVQTEEKTWGEWIEEQRQQLLDREKIHTDPVQNTLGVIALVFIMLFVGQILKHFSDWTGLPYTAVVTVVGALLFFSPLHYMPAMQVMDSLDAHTILMLFIPALIFESAFNADWYIFKKQLAKILFLAGPALIICGALTAVVMFYVLSYGTTMVNGKPMLGWWECIMFGAIVSATDPVSVVAMLKDMGASKRLATTIEGESLLNDGTAMVIFLIMVDLVEGADPAWWQVLLKFLRLAVGGPIIGLVFGWVLTFLLSLINKKPVLEANLTVVFAYLCFFVAQHDYVDTSGILALCVLGLYTSHYGKPNIDNHSREAIHTIWSYITFVAETLIFFLAGLIMAKTSIELNVNLSDAMKTLILYGLIFVIRWIVLMMHYPIFSNIGAHTSVKQLTFMTYAGLRGAMGLTLCLILMKRDKIPERVSNLIMFHVSCLVFLTLCINGTTTACVMRCLGLQTSSLIEKKNIVDFIHDFKDQKVKILQDMQENMPYLRGVDWQRLELDTLIPHFEKFYKKNKNIFIMNSQLGDDGRIRLSDAMKNWRDGKVVIPERELLANMRYRYLMMVKARYQKQADCGLMYPETLVLLDHIGRMELDSCTSPLNSAQRMISVLGANSCSDRCWQAFVKACCRCYTRRMTWGYEMKVYDALLNFLEVNKVELAALQERQHSDETKAEERFRMNVCREVQRQIMIADTLLHQRFLTINPELVVEANQRRAKYYLCTQQVHFTNQLVEDGLIRDKHAKPILIDVKENIRKLKLKRPKYHSIPCGNLIMNSSLLQIFGEETCTKLLKSKFKTRQIIESRKIIEPNEKAPFCYFVTRGSVIESTCQMTDEGMQTIMLDFEIGSCAGMQHIHPLFEGQSKTTIQCQENHHANVACFDIRILQKAMARDVEVEKRFWQHVAPRLIFLEQCDEFQVFRGHTLQEIMTIINNCDYVTLTKADPPKMFPHGGILLYGEFHELLYENSFEWIPPCADRPYTLNSKKLSAFVIKEPIKRMDSNSMLTYAQVIEQKTREERLMHLYNAAHTKKITPGEEVKVNNGSFGSSMGKHKSSSVTPYNINRKSRSNEKNRLLDHSAGMTTIEQDLHADDQLENSGMFPPIKQARGVEMSNTGANFHDSMNNRVQVTGNETEKEKTLLKNNSVNIKSESATDDHAVGEDHDHAADKH